MKLKRLHYGWVIVIVSIGIIATQTGFFGYTFGIYLRPLTAEFGWDRGAVAAAVSISSLVSGGLAILTGRIADKYGPRPLVTVGALLAGTGFFLMSRISSLWQVYLIWGLVLAIAGSCANIPVITAIPRWFTKNRGRAVALTWTGLGLGASIAPSLAQWLIASYGWRQAYFTEGLIVLLVVIPLAQFLRHSPQRVGLKPYGEDEATEAKQSPAASGEAVSFKQAIRTGRFWLFSLRLFSWTFFLQVVLVHLPAHAIDIGISATIAASLISIIGITSLVGRNLMGFIADKTTPALALMVIFAVTTSALIWLLFAKEVWMFYLFAVSFGIAYAGVTPVQTMATAESFGLKFLGMIQGSLMFFGTIGGAISAPLSGRIFDATGGYTFAFWMAIIVSALALVISLLLLKARGLVGRAPDTGHFGSGG